MLIKSGGTAITQCPTNFTIAVIDAIKTDYTVGTAAFWMYRPARGAALHRLKQQLYTNMCEVRYVLLPVGLDGISGTGATT